MNKVTKFPRVLVLPNVKGGGAESSTYSPSSCRSCPRRPLFSSTLRLACGFLGAFLSHLAKGSEREKFGCSRLRVMWS